MNYRLRKSLGTVAAISGLLVLFFAVHIISMVHYHRTDLTRDRLYTLSPGTHSILNRISSPLTINFYFSSGEKNVPQPVKDFARRVNDLLRELELAGNGKVTVCRIDARPESGMDDTLAMTGIEPRFLADEQHYFYFGIEVASVDRTFVIPALDPARERTLEYELARAIQQVTTARKKTIGVFSALPMLGAANQPNLFNVRASTRPWMCIRELEKDYNLRPVALDAKALPDDLDLLLLIHPRGLSPATQYLVEQFLLRGGPVVLFLDPLCSTEMKGFGARSSLDRCRSDLSELLLAWGVAYDSSLLVVDPGYSVDKTTDAQPAFLELDAQAMGREDVISSSLNRLLLPYAGALLAADRPDRVVTPLVSSSANARLLPVKDVLENPKLMEQIEAQKPAVQHIALKLSGLFQSAWPGGAPDPEVRLGHAPLAKSARPGAVVLVADADLLEDRVWTQRYFNRFTNRETTSIRNDNNNLLLNAVEQLSGGDDLIAIRSRSDLPDFTRLTRMRQEADERLREEFLRWQKASDETEKRLAALREAGGGSQRFLESPEEAKEREDLNRRRLEVAENIKRLRRERRREIDSLGAQLLWLNVGAMPLAVVFFGLGVGLWRKLR